MASTKDIINIEESEVCYYRDTVGNWRNIIFLPHNILWKTFVSCSVIFSSILVMYNLIFTTELWPIDFFVCFYIFEVVYFFDTILSVMHRYMYTYRRTRLYAPKPLFVIMLDIISLIPYYEIYYLLRRSSEGADYEYSRDYIKFKVLLRLQTPVAFFFSIKNQPGLNQVYIVICGQLFQFIIYSVIMSSIWYFIKDIDKNNWQKNLKYHQFDRNSSLHWFIVCVSAIGNTFAHNSAGAIGSESSTEYLIVIISMMCGCLLHIMIFFGELTAQYIKKFQYQFMYATRMNIIVDILNNWEFNEKTTKQVIHFYNIFWEKRCALSNMPELFRKLPVSLQKEAQVDVFWELFRHSHFFNELETSFKRSLALSIKSKFYLPGDYLFLINQIKVQMFYIVSGVVQILSQEDQKSPVMSCSNGTLFGEISCLMGVSSSANIRCATYCEVYILELKELSKVLTHFPKVSKILHDKLQKRIYIARRMQHPDMLRIKDKEQRRTSLRWIKQQWRHILFQTRLKKSDAHKTIIASEAHISNFLDLYVMSDDLELKMNAICLRSTCPYVMDPSNSFLKFCNFLILGVVILQSMFVPYVVFFQRDMTTTNRGLFYMMDMFYIFGIYLELSTAIKSNKRLISEIKEILSIKCKRISTIVDIFATFPLEIIAYIFNYSHSVQRVLHLNRVLKIHKLYWLLRVAEKNLMVNHLRLRLVKYILTFSYMIYFCGCLLFGTTCFEECTEFGWLRYSKHLETMLNVKSAETGDFLVSIGYSVSMLLSLTDSHFYSYSLIDMTIEVLITLIGYFLFSLCFSELASCAVLQLNHKIEYQSHLKALKHFLNYTNIDPELRRMTYSYVQCHWQYSFRYLVTGENSIFRDGSDHIKHTLVLRRIVNCLKQVPLFGICDEDLLWNVANAATVLVVPPNTILSYENAYSRHFKIIMRGYCIAESSIPTDKYHGYTTTLTVGDAFPLLEVLLHINSFERITTETFVEFASISYADLMVHLKYMPDFYEDICSVLKLHVKEHDTILMRRKGRLPEMRSIQKSFGKGEYFKYETNEEFDKNLNSETFTESFSKLGKWKFLRHFFLRNTLSPTKRTYMIWECTRGMLALCNTIYILLFMKQTYHTSSQIYITHIMDAIGLFDIYIKMHCEYYTEKGILITHPLYTAKHYLNTSFALDLYCTFPITTFRLNQMMHSEYEYQSLIIAMLITRPLQMYRVMSGLTYLQMESKEGKSVLIQRIKYGIMIVVILGVIACFMELNVCHYSSSTTYECKTDSWIGRSVFKNHTSVGNVIFISYYEVLTIFSTSCVGVFIMKTHDEMVIDLLIVFILLFVRWFILAKITSSSIGGDTTLITYQTNMKIFLKFTRQHYIRQELVKETVDHYENLWKWTNGVHEKTIFASYPLVISNNISMSLYGPSFKLAEIFKGADDSVIRYFSSNFSEYYFKKDAQIIRCNDVQEYIYIVHKGKVEISVANTRLSILTVGGVFGCMQMGKTRQTITAQAKVHVNLLKIKSTVFFKMMNDHPLYANMKKHVRRATLLHSEYFPPISETQTQDNAYISEDTTKSFFLINSSSKWYHVYNYVTNVHIAVISSMVLMVMIVQVGEISLTNYYYVGYGFDFIFFIKLIIGFLLSYIDHESGWMVTSPRKICIRYMSLFDGFWFNLLTTFPFEISVRYLRHTENHAWYRFFWSNRLLRFLFMVNYYKICKNTLTVSKTLRWTYLMYIMIFLIHFMSCLWWLVACPNEKCKYLDVASHTRSEFIETTDSSLAFRICYQYVVTVFTSTGLRDQVPMNIPQIITSIVIICISQVILLALTAGFASMLVLENYKMGIFERDVGLVRNYMKTLELSLSLKNKISNYFKELWVRSAGSWLPELIDEAPPYLKQDMMSELYGHYLTKHPLFGKTHVDFLRQLVVHFKSNLYMPGQYVVEKGDIDGTMYFITEGEVIVYDLHGNNEIEQFVLHRGRSFGENQGLSMIEHVRSYKASVVSIIISLRKQDWEYLLDWFPASKEVLDTRKKEFFDYFH